MDAAISTHALREEGDQPGSLLCTINRIFLPTPSARRATVRQMMRELGLS